MATVATDDNDEMNAPRCIADAGHRYLVAACAKIRRKTSLDVEDLGHISEIVTKGDRLVSLSFLQSKATGDMVVVLGRKETYVVVFSTFEARSPAPLLQKFNSVCPVKMASHFGLVLGVGVSKPPLPLQEREKERMTTKCTEILLKDFELMKTRLLEDLRSRSSSRCVKTTPPAAARASTSGGTTRRDHAVPSRQSRTPPNADVEEDDMSRLRRTIEIRLVRQARLDDADDRQNESLRKEIEARRRRRATPRRPPVSTPRNQTTVSASGTRATASRARAAPMDAGQTAKEVVRKEQSISGAREHAIAQAKERQRRVDQDKERLAIVEVGKFIGGH